MALKGEVMPDVYTIAIPSPRHLTPVVGGQRATHSRVRLRRRYRRKEK